MVSETKISKGYQTVVPSELSTPNSASLQKFEGFILVDGNGQGPLLLLFIWNYLVELLVMPASLFPLG